MALPVLNAAKYKTVIPSLGKEVEYRPYLVKEEKILMIALESKDQKQILTALKDVIKACVYDDIDVNRLAMFDLEALFLKLRGKSVGESTELKVKCTQCDAENQQQINFDEIKMPVIVKQSNVIELTDDVGVTLSYPTVGGMEKQNLNASGIDQALDMIIHCVDSIYDANNVYAAKDEGLAAVRTFIDSLNSSQFKKLTEFFEDVPAVTYDMKFDCIKCGIKNNTELRGFDNFFG
tara:strand:- start:458 stop:1162 length:705 start_codon:yes stop_codon:yes gene_type:complete